MKNIVLFLSLIITITSQSQTYDEELYENRDFFKIYEQGEDILITTNEENIVFSGFIGFRSNTEGTITIKPKNNHTLRIIPTTENNPRGTGTQIGIRPWNSASVQSKTTLYPNPAKSMIQLKSSESILGYKIFDSQGTLKSENSLLKSKQFSVNINNLISGIYHAVILLDNGQSISKQFIKQ